MVSYIRKYSYAAIFVTSHAQEIITITARVKEKTLCRVVYNLTGVKFHSEWKSFAFYTGLDCDGVHVDINMFNKNSDNV